MESLSTVSTIRTHKIDKILYPRAATKYQEVMESESRMDEGDILSLHYLQTTSSAIRL